MNKQANQYWVLGHKVKYIPTVGDYGFLAIESNPKVPGPPPHYHQNASELFYIIEGEMDVMSDGTWMTLRSGESFTVPVGSVHTFINNSDKPVQWVTAFSPRGFEKFFLDFGISIDEKDAFEKSIAQDLINKVIADAEKYGMILSG